MLFPAEGKEQGLGRWGGEMGVQELLVLPSGFIRAHR